MAGIAVGSLALQQALVPVAHRFYRPFFAPADSMAPTIGRGDRFVADMRWRGPLRRGDIVLFQAADSIRVDRIAALPGDRVAMRAGVPVIDGIAVRQQVAGRARTIADDGSGPVTVRRERLPGERGAHLVLDAEPSAFDDTATVVVPPHRLFVLGDNRDRSADSRVPPDELGVGLVPVAAIVGRPLSIYWSGDRGRIGRRLDGG